MPYIPEIKIGDTTFDLKDKLAVVSTGIGIFNQSDAQSYSAYANLDTAPTNKIFTIGRDGVRYVANYPTALVMGATIVTYRYIKSENLSGAIQVAYGLAPDNGYAVRANTGSWSDWVYYQGVDRSENYLLSTTLTNGYVIDGNSGQPISNEYTTNYSITDYIPVSAGKKIEIGYVQGYGTLIGGMVYDSDKNPLFQIGYDKVYNGAFAIDITDYRAAYVRANIVPTYIFSRNSNYVIISDSEVQEPIKDIYVYNSAFITSYKNRTNNWFMKIKDACDYINENNIMGATVHVYPGTYDLVSELGSSFLNNYDGSSRYDYGLLFGHDTHWIFSEGAYLRFLYEGSNVNVPELFSPLVINGGCTLENLDIEVKNCQYCVHDDWYVRISGWIIKYINCKMKHNGNTFGSYETTVCIGGGTEPNEIVVIEGGEYTCPSSFNYPISYHTLYSNFGYTVYSRLIFKDVWLSGAFRLQDAPYDVNPVNVTITGCSQGDDIGGTHTFFTIKEWNNIIRE